MLEVVNLRKTYNNGVKALQGVNLSVKKGMFGLLGPNGAGKSSLMRTLATLQTPDSGHITFDGFNIQENPDALRKRLGYLPQSFGVYPRVTAYDLLDHLAALKGLTNKAQRKEAVSGLLARTNLYQHRDKAVSGFSGGMRQRFGIAQALLGDPDMIIVDEPTGGLDPEERNRFHNLLVSLGEEKVIILSTHIVEDVCELCPNMAILANGHIVANGQPQQLIQQYHGQIWRKSINNSDLTPLDPNLNVISQRRFAGENIIHIWSNDAPAGFEPAPTSLEDVYFAIIKHQLPEIVAEQTTGRQDV